MDIKEIGCRVYSIDWKYEPVQIPVKGKWTRRN